MTEPAYKGPVLERKPVKPMTPKDVRQANKLDSKFGKKPKSK